MVSWWFHYSRRDFKRLPPIESLSEYEKSWIAWWTKLQPNWRNMDDWPFPRAATTDDPWDDLLVRGKDGVFVIVMTLAWWSIEHTKMGVKLSQLDAAIADVSWVLFNLISTLSTRDSLPHISAGPSTGCSRVSRKVGPPNKCVCT